MRAELASRVAGSMTGAVFSADRTYRYVLWRTWGTRGPLIHFVGLNPSTADEYTNDPTIRRCIGFAQSNGARGLLVSNLFAFRATKPVDLLVANEPIGSETDFWLVEAHRLARTTVACWGVHGVHAQRAASVMTTLKILHCLGVTKDGHPRHPLYLKRDTPLQRYRSELVSYT